MIFSKKDFDVNNKMDIYRALYSAQTILLHALSTLTRMKLVKVEIANESGKQIRDKLDILINQKEYYVVDRDDNTFEIKWRIHEDN